MLQVGGVNVISTIAVLVIDVILLVNIVKYDETIDLFRLVIGTKKGIFIYTLILDPYNTEEELNFKKDFIPTKPMQPDYEPLMGQVCLLVN